MGALAKTWLWLCAIAGITIARPLAAHAASDAPRVSILTFGPGDAAFARFGHNALRVRKSTGRRAERDRVYNFGTFSFDSPFLLVDFLRGRLRYWLSVDSFEHTLHKYRSLNRSIVEQELDLEASRARALAAALEVTARPENREYLYDYYRDNCSTRVRDALDGALGGALRARWQVQTPLTYRDHTLRQTDADPMLNVTLDWVLNDRTDRRLSVWEAAFLPERLQESLRTIPAPGGPPGRPLVRAERTLYDPNRPPIPDVPRDTRAAFALSGALVGALLCGLGFFGARGPRWRRVLAAAAVSSSAVFGALGVLLLLLWTTNHEVVHANENLLQCAPWTLALPLLVGGVVRRDPRACRRFERLLAAAAVLSGLGLVLKLLPAFDQGGVRIALFLAPMWFGATGAAAFLRREVRVPARQKILAAAVDAS